MNKDKARGSKENPIEIPDHENEKVPEVKLDKGKARASESEVLGQESKSQFNRENTKPNSLRPAKNMNEFFDLLLSRSPKSTTNSDNEVFNNLLYKPHPEQQVSPSDSSYTVYSSEIHSDDSAKTKEAKLQVKEEEKSLKRKYPFDENE